MMRVLALESAAPDIAVLEAIAEGHSFALSVVADGRTLFTEVDYCRPDVILLDVQIPGESGYEICRQLKAAPGTRTIPIFLMTPYMTLETKAQAVDAGCDAYFEKPLDRRDLAFRITSFGRLRRAWTRSLSSDRILVALTRFIVAKQQGESEVEGRLEEACRSFGLALALPPLELDALVLAATLHDIGEIAIPSELLATPGPLTAEDMAIVQRHPEIGAAMIEPLPDTGLLVGIVRHHHERWDGGGYPYGLEGPEIPRLARIFRLLDVFDALTRNRPWRKGLSVSAALDELRREAATGAIEPALLRPFEAWLADEGSSFWR